MSPIEAAAGSPAPSGRPGGAPGPAPAQQRDRCERGRHGAPRRRCTPRAAVIDGLVTTMTASLRDEPPACEPDCGGATRWPPRGAVPTVHGPGLTTTCRPSRSDGWLHSASVSYSQPDGADWIRTAPRSNGSWERSTATTRTRSCIQMAATGRANPPDVGGSQCGGGPAMDPCVSRNESWHCSHHRSRIGTSPTLAGRGGGVMPEPPWRGPCDRPRLRS